MNYSRNIKKASIGKRVLIFGKSDGKIFEGEMPGDRKAASGRML